MTNEEEQEKKNIKKVITRNYKVYKACKVELLLKKSKIDKKVANFTRKK